MECTACGVTVGEGDRFCIGCGRPTGEVVPAVESRGGLAYAAQAPATPPPPGNLRPPTGDPHEQPAPVTGDDGGRRLPSTWLLVGAGVVVLVVVVLGLSALGGGDGGGTDTGAASARPTLPREPESAWRESYDGQLSIGGSSDALFAIHADDESGEGELARYASSDGDEAWRVDVDMRYPYLEAVGGGVVVVSGSEDEDRVLIGYDADDGEERWSTDLDGYVATFGGVPFLAEENDDGTLESISQFDLATGEDGERIRADALTVIGDRVLAIDDDEVEIFDLASFDSLADPIPVDDDRTAMTVDGDRLLIAVDDEVQRLGDDGRPDRTTVVDLDSISQIRVVDGKLLVSGDGEVHVVEPTDGQADDVWSEDGFVRDVEGDTVLVTDDEDLVAYALGDGERRWSEDSSDDVQLAAPGIVLVQSYTSTSRIDALDLETGESLWDVDGYVIPVPGGMVNVEPDDDGSGGDFEVLR